MPTNIQQQAQILTIVLGNQEKVQQKTRARLDAQNHSVNLQVGDIGLIKYLRIQEQKPGPRVLWTFTVTTVE